MSYLTESVVSATLICVTTLLIATNANATPMTYTARVKNPNKPSETILKTLPGIAQWPDGTIINVFLNHDPGKGNRQQEIKKGVSRWSKKLKQKNITLNFKQGQAQPGAKNSVEIKWAEPGSLPNSNKQFGDTNTMISRSQDKVDRIRGAQILIDKRANDKQFLKNLGMHEFGHALGLSDDPTQDKKNYNAMDTNVRAGVDQTFSERDDNEFKTIYGSKAGQRPKGDLLGSVSKTNGVYRYQYQLKWIAGPEIPLIQIESGNDFYDLEKPSNWRLFDPNDPSSYDGYLEDVSTTTLGDDPLKSTNDFYTFFSTTNPLSPANNIGNFSFAGTAAPTDGLAYSPGTGFSTVPSPSPSRDVAVPEPPTLFIFLATFCFFLLAIVKRQEPTLLFLR